MARHMIYESAPTTEEQRRRIEIQWERGFDVRVASTHWAGDGTPDPNRAYLDQPHPDAELKHAWDGQFVVLDRQQLNHLIRQLRAARDQAYGKDE